MKRVVVITNIPAPYRVDFFDYLRKHYTDYEFTLYEANQYPTLVTENVSNLYVRRDDGFAQFSLGYFNKNKDKTINIVILLQNENIIGVAIQINS